jgi:hypothetical protein
MRLNILCDVHWESRVDRTLRDLSSSGYRGLFDSRDYGQGLSGIAVVLMCRNPSLKFKRRVRFVRKEKTLHMDIMLDFDQMRKADDPLRTQMVADRLADEVPSVLRKYSFPDFDEARFVEDLKGWLKTIGNPP